MGILSKFHGLQTEKVEISHEYNISVDIEDVFLDDEDLSETLEGEFEEITEEYKPTESLTEDDDDDSDDLDFLD